MSMNTEYELYAKAAFEELGKEITEKRTKVEDSNVENIIVTAEPFNNFEFTPAYEIENSLISQNESKMNTDGISSQDLNNMDDDNNEKSSAENKKSPFNCLFCGKEYMRSYDLAKHVRTHTSAEPHGSLYRKGKFTQVSHLKSRTGVYREETPYECDYCGRRFADRSTLRVHVSVHSEKSFIRGIGRSGGPSGGEKCNKWNRMQCNKCKLYFWRSIDLERHIRSHNIEIQQHLESGLMDDSQLAYFSNQFLVPPIQSNSVEFQEVTNYDLENLDNIIIKEEPYDDSTEDFVCSYEEHNDFLPEEEPDATAMIMNIRSRWARIMYERI